MSFFACFFSPWAPSVMVVADWAICWGQGTKAAIYIYIETHRRRKKQTDRSSLREPGGRKRQEEWMYAFVGTSTYIRFREFLLFRLVGASSAFLSSFLSNH